MYICVYIYIYTQICVCIYICVCMYACVYLYIYIYICDGTTSLPIARPENPARILGAAGMAAAAACTLRV